MNALKKVVISQPRYLPAVNYIQRLCFADAFVFLDNVQRQGRGIENRNKILLNNEVKWLTIPISSSSRELIKNSIVSNIDWVDIHKKALFQAYNRCPFFDSEIASKYYSNINSLRYTGMITRMTFNLCEMLGFTPRVILASELDIDQQSSGPEKLYQICEAVEADLYISGSNGREYGVKEHFKSKSDKVNVVFHDFDYPIYKQHNNDNGFVPWLCFFDMVFNCGLINTKEVITESVVFKDI